MEFVKLKTEDRIMEIMLDRADKRNALNSKVVDELKDAFRRADADDNVRVVILKSNGPAFSAGADLGYLQQLQNNTYEENLEDSSSLKELFELIYFNKKIVIAQVEGHAIAGGCGLATVCDLSYSVPEAMFGYTEVKIGFIPAIVMFFLLRKIGEAKARKLLLTGQLVSAEEAKETGMITDVVAPTEIENTVRTIATQIANETSPQSIALTKKMIAEIQSMPADEALAYAAEMNAEARATDDCKRGISAFLNKEKLKW